MRSLSITFLVLTLLMGVKAQSQETHISPFSRYGIGDLSSPGYTRNFGMGGVGMSLSSISGLDPSNPGHYGRLAEPTMEFGVLNQNLRITSDSKVEEISQTQLRNMAFGFPAADRWTVAFGIHPYSRRGYNFTKTTVSNDFGEVNTTYSGSGEIQQVFLGNGYELIKQGDSLSLGIGLNVSYLFGTLEADQRSVFTSSGFFNSVTRSEVHFSNFVMDAGMHFQKKFIFNRGSDDQKPLRLMMSATMDIPNQLEAERTFISGNYTTFSSNLKDTIQYIEDEPREFTMPLGIGGGVGFEFDERLTVGLEMKWQDWSAFSPDSLDKGLELDLKDRMVARAGLEFTPRNDYSRSSTYFSYCDYRVGFNYTQEYYLVNGESLDDLGISFGLGLPLLRSSSFSRLDVGLEYSTRGSVETMGLKEEYFKAYFGVSLSPHRADQWFRKPKIR